MNLNTEILKPILEHLTPQTNPSFGKLTAQQMVEHVLKTFRISSGKIRYPFPQDLEKAQAARQYMIYTDAEMPSGIRTSTMEGDLPPALEYESLELAIQSFLHEVENFHLYFKHNPNAETSHPRMGVLTYEEWNILHQKHLIHHFKQFGLI